MRLNIGDTVRHISPEERIGIVIDTSGFECRVRWQDGKDEWLFMGYCERIRAPLATGGA